MHEHLANAGSKICILDTLRLVLPPLRRATTHASVFPKHASQKARPPIRAFIAFGPRGAIRVAESRRLLHFPRRLGGWLPRRRVGPELATKSGSGRCRLKSAPPPTSADCTRLVERAKARRGEACRDVRSDPFDGSRSSTRALISAGDQCCRSQRALSRQFLGSEARPRVKQRALAQMTSQAPRRVKLQLARLMDGAPTGHGWLAFSGPVPAGAEVSFSK